MIIKFNELPAITAEYSRGRNVHEGYVRAFGLEFEELGQQIERDDDYRYCQDVCDGRAIIGPRNLYNIFLILKYFLPKVAAGNIVEFGSNKGGTALFMAAAAKRFLPSSKVFALDTFSGMPKTDSRIDLHNAGDFSDVDLPALRDHARRAGLNNLEFIQGRFEDTYPKRSGDIGQISFNHIDCDIRSAVAYAYDATKPFMAKGGYIVFDDALYSSCMGATEVVEDLVNGRDRMLSEQVYPHHVFRSGLDAAVARSIAPPKGALAKLRRAFR